MDNTIKSTNSNPKEYYERDLGLCSAIYLTEGIRLLRIEKDPSGFSWFVFSNKPLCQTVAKKYWFDQLVLENAKAYNDARKSLMDKLHAQI